MKHTYTTPQDSAQKPRFSKRYQLALPGIIAVLSVLAMPAVFAQTISETWDGGGVDDNWSTAANWTNDQVPNNQFVDFAGTTRTNPNNDIAAGKYIWELRLKNTTSGQSFTLDGNSVFVHNAVRTYDVASGNITDVINMNIDTLNGHWVTGTNHDLTMNGLAGSGGDVLIKSGGGTLTLAGANTYTGATTVNAGTLSVTNSSNTPSYTIASGATLDLSSSITANTAISGGGTLNITGSVWANTQSLTTQMDSGAYIDITAGSTLGFNGGNDAWTGNLADVNVDGLLRGAANNFEIDALTGSGEVRMSQGTIVLGVDGGGGTFSGTFNDSYGPDGYLRKEGSGTQELTGAIDLGTGSTVTVNGGTLKIANSSTASSYNIASGATLELASGYTIAGGASGATTFTGGGTLLVSGNISGQADQLKMSMDSGATINIQGGGSLTYGSGGDEWTGNLADVINNGNMYGAANSFIIDKLDGSGSMTMGSGTINLGVDNGDGGVFNGSIGRNYADAHINKQGTGTQTLNGSVNMGSSGTVTVSGGTLVFNGTSSGSNATGSWIVQNGATLSGSGTLSGTATIGDGATLSPGNSPGTQTFDNLTWTNGGAYLWEINDSGGTKGADPGWDWLDITGTLELGSLSAGGFTIDIDSLAGAVAGDAAGFGTFGIDGYESPFDVDYSFIIASAASINGFNADNFSLDFSGFSALSPEAGWHWEIIQNGTDLVLQAYAVPEPSSTALLGLGGLILAFRRKR